MASKLTRDELLAKEIKQETQNVNDAIYINLTKFIGASVIVIAVGILITRGLRFDLTTIFLFVLGLAILGGTILWESDDKKNLDKILEIENNIADEENEGERTQNYTQNN